MLWIGIDIGITIDIAIDIENYIDINFNIVIGYIFEVCPEVMVNLQHILSISYKLTNQRASQICICTTQIL